MIFTLPFQDIEWSTIEEFCNQYIPEGTFLDYKAQFPANLEKTISALANTFGGVILIGVEADNANKPITPIKGIEFQIGLSEKVISIILSHITPPFIPEIKVCQNSDKKKAIVFIRVAQSDITPHAISGNTEVYIRTNDINHPEKIASLDEVEWLNNKRNKSLELKNLLINQSKSRFDEMKSWSAMKNDDIYRSLNNQKNELEISILPIYPVNWYKSPNDLFNCFDKIKIIDNYLTCTYFPPSNSSLTGHEINILQDGVFLIHNKGMRFFYTEINSYGLYYYKQCIDTFNKNNQDYIKTSELFNRIKSSFIFVSSYFKTIGYYGLIEINIRLEKITGSGLYYDLGNNKEMIGFCPDNDFIFKKNLLVQDIEGKLDDTLDSIFERIGWLFGQNLPKIELLKH